MTKYREILRLLSNQLKTDEIVHACSVSKKTVIKVKKRARELEISWPLDADMTDEKLETIMFPKPEKSVSTKRMPDFEYVRKELLRNGVNKKLLWTEYLEQLLSSLSISLNIPALFVEYIVHGTYRQQVEVPRSTSARKERGQRNLGVGRVCSVCWALAPPVHKYFSLWIFAIVDFRLFPFYTLDYHHYPLWIFTIVDFRLFLEEST